MRIDIENSVNSFLMQCEKINQISILQDYSKAKLFGPNVNILLFPYRYTLYT